MTNEYFTLQKIDSWKDLKHGDTLVENSDVYDCPEEALVQRDANDNNKFLFSQATNYLHKCRIGNPKKYSYEGTFGNSGEIYVQVTSNGVTKDIISSKIKQNFSIYRTVNLNPKYYSSNELYLTCGEHGLVYKPLKRNGDVFSNFGEISPSPTINFPGGPYAHGTSSPGHFEKPIAVQGGNAWEGKTHGIYSPALLNTKPIDIRENSGEIHLGHSWMETPIILNNINLNNLNQNEVSRLSQAISRGEEIQGHTIRGRVKEATITSRPVEHRAISAK